MRICFSTQRDPGSSDVSRRLSVRLESIEKRLADLDDTPGNELEAAVSRQGAEIEALSARASGGSDKSSPSVEELRHELQGWVSSTLNSRLADIEERLRVESEEKQKAVLDAFVDSVQTRVVQRIAKLENDVSTQGATLSELKDYSVQTERNMHKLLESIERLVGNQKQLSPVQIPVMQTDSPTNGVNIVSSNSKPDDHSGVNGRKGLWPRWLR